MKDETMRKGDRKAGRRPAVHGKEKQSVEIGSPWLCASYVPIWCSGYDASCFGLACNLQPSLRAERSPSMVLPSSLTDSTKTLRVQH